jgi:predicted ATP-dependent Lon-type protease
MPTTASKAAPATNDALDAKRAIEVAWDYFHTLFSKISTSDVSVEEVELASDRKHWLITLSFFEERRSKALHLPAFLQVPRQKFKVFKIERGSGRVVSMKMRNGG